MYFTCKNCSWSGFDILKGDTYKCPDCGALLYSKETAPQTPNERPKITHTYFTQTTGTTPGVFLLNSGEWQFVCECGHAENWRTKKLAETNYQTHRMIHDLAKELIPNDG